MIYDHAINGKEYECCIDILSDTEPYELNIAVNGSSYHILLGSHFSGNFICIPNWKVGCELASYSDTFWNVTSLEEHLNPIDAECIVYSIKEVNKILEMD